MNQPRTLKLHLGCGEKYLPGYVNIDFPQSQHRVMKVKADIYADFRELSYEAGSVAEIRSHHVLEHYSRAEALKILLLWRRWLKPGGSLVVETPDFWASVVYYLFGGFREKMEIGRHIFGSQEAEWAYHKDFWDKKKYRYILPLLGFEKIKFKRFSNDVTKKYGGSFSNFLGSFLPLALLKKYGGKKLPNILVYAQKSAREIDERAAARQILSNYLVGRESEAMLNIWLREVFDE